MENPTFALIIGVDDYSSLDPSGTSNLAGATNDVKAWWRLCTGHLRIAASNIRVLSRGHDGTPLTADQLTGDTDGATLADATRQDILGGIAWLGEQVRTHNGAGLVTFSGHGVGLQAAHISEEGSTESLAPAGITEVTLDQLVTAADYDAAIKASDAVDGSTLTGKQTVMRITNLFDACYNRVDETQRRSLGVLDNASVPPRVLSRLLLGCQMNQSSYEILMNGRWRGAFSHSIQTLMERWNTAVDDNTGVRYLQCSYDNLIFRSREHLNLLGVPQTPTMVSAMARHALVPVLRPGMALVDGQTVDVPNAPMKREEYSPGENGIVLTTLEYSGIPNSGGARQIIAVAILPGTNSSGTYGSSFKSDSEYWRFNTPALLNNTQGFKKWKLRAEVYTSWPSNGTIPIIDASSSPSYQQWPDFETDNTWDALNTPPGGASYSGGTYQTDCKGGKDQNNNTFAFQLAWNTTTGQASSIRNYIQNSNSLILVNNSTSNDSTTMNVPTIPVTTTTDGWKQIIQS